MSTNDMIGCEGETCESWVFETQIVRRWQVMKKEILLHKWYESERAGYDIGFERAAMDWMIRFGGRASE